MLMIKLLQKTPNIRNKSEALFTGPYKIIDTDTPHQKIKIDRGAVREWVPFERIKPFKKEKAECRKRQI